jgi:poly(hydroxyalkanoate) granule-associated protein
MKIVTSLKQGVSETTRQVYLASLGVAVTVAERSKKMFDHFVEKGQSSAAKAANVEENVASRTNRVRDFAVKAGDRFQETVSNSLGRLGMPTRDEVHALTRNVELLTEKVKNLQTENAA